MSMKQKIGSFKKINKIGKLLGKMNKEKRNMNKITKFRTKILLILEKLKES
jgi:hypothetical protein